MTQTYPTHNEHPVSLAKMFFALLIVMLLAACNREANNNFKNPDAADNAPAVVANTAETSVEQQYAEVNRQWLATNGKQDGITTTASGLQYAVKKEGDGKSPTINDIVSVKYTGKLIDGTVFDSTEQNNGGEPVTFPLAGVVQGWQEGLQLMKEGSEYTLFLPAALAYGEQPVGSIPANSTLVFDVELVKVMTEAEALAEIERLKAEQAAAEQAKAEQPAEQTTEQAATGQTEQPAVEQASEQPAATTEQPAAEQPAQP
ncbi:MAG: FKBP-type peptidyl-prolyl cis-trans isomerase [Neisseriaceae bacterium]|nr:FKBP-type peptidyl-prolyl cis-trans isomerase [Neisseriaceae bacterium]